MIKPVKSKKEYEKALKRIYSLMQENIRPDSAESNELEIHSILVKEYENKHYPVPKPNPIEAIKFRLEQLNMSEAELSEILGYRSRKSEIFSGKRKLSLLMIRKLNQLLHIPADVLIQVYKRFADLFSLGHYFFFPGILSYVNYYEAVRTEVLTAQEYYFKIFAKWIILAFDKNSDFSDRPNYHLGHIPLNYLQ